MPTKNAKTESDGFTAEERAAMKKRAAELRAEGKKGAKQADGLQAVLDSIAEMTPEDRALAERVHVAVTVTCTRSASARSAGAISAMLSRTACKPSAFLAPFLPSARNSAARFFIAARSWALKPPDSVSAFFAGILGLPFLRLGGSV